MHGDGWSMSGYADGAYDFGNKISLIAGLRYNYDQRSAASGYGVNAPAPATRFQEATEKQWTPRVGLRYAVGERANVYATYSQGFKSGAFDVTSPNGPGVKPETVDAFEVGFKSASSDFTFNAAAYYYDYKDTQVNATISGESGRIFTQLFNVPKSRIYGAEADGSLPLGDAFDLRVALAYTHARYIDFPSASAYINDPTNPATLGGLIFANISVDVSGNTMVRAPEFTTSATLSYHTPLGDNNELEIALSPYYSSRVYFTFDNSKSQDPYVTLDGAATLTSGEHMKFSLFGRNLTDKTYAISIGQNALSLASTTFATPRTYGVSFGYTF
jgi:iron complex outermembrane receptor protein